MMKFGVDVSRFGHRGPDLFPEQMTVAATQPVHHLLDGAFGRPEALGHVVVAHPRFTARQIAFELLELGAATCLLQFLTRDEPSPARGW